MTTLSSMSIINDNGIINYKLVFERTKSSFGHSSREYVPSKLGRNCDSPSITKYTSTNTRN